MEFQIGDRIRLEKPFNKSVRATIINVDRLADSSGWKALVLREDNHHTDVWVWHDYQSGKSVFNEEKFLTRFFRG